MPQTCMMFFLFKRSVELGRGLLLIST
uniref:Uncharacterized protein n=1 Tax=Arundo donax TaxID=35708 RepID=A0A0A9AZP0_ARUDO